MEEKVIRASFDRLEGDFAVVYADNFDHDNDHETYYKKFDVPLELVKDAKPGARLKLYTEDGFIERIEIDKETTDKSRDKISRKYEKLNQPNIDRQHEQ